MANIFIVEDHPIMRQGLRSLLDREADLTVCGEAASAETALEQMHPPLPDLVLIDVSLPGMSGIELTRTLHTRHPDLLLAMLSGHGERTHVNQALDAGARGYILKGESVKLPAALRQVLNGDLYLSPEVSSARSPSVGPAAAQRPPIAGESDAPASIWPEARSRGRPVV